MLRTVLLGIGDPELTADVLDTKRGESIRYLLVDELRTERGVESKCSIPNGDLGRPEVGGEQEEAAGVIADRESLVHRSGGKVRVGNHDLGSRSKSRLPGGDRPVLGRPNEKCRSCGRPYHKRSRISV